MYVSRLHTAPLLREYIKAEAPLPLSLSAISDSDCLDPHYNSSDCDYTGYCHSTRESKAELELLRESLCLDEAGAF